MITPPTPPPTPFTAEQMTAAIIHLKTVAHWLVILLVLNVILSA
jgi:hypothetical protein